jgi:electron transfer flavoprotein alpha/beta subunit
MEMGADQGFHLRYEHEDYLSPSIKSRLIAEFCRDRDYDLILTGVMSEDMMSGQTGLMTAARLGMPSVASVMKLEVDLEKQCLQVERELDSGHRCLMELKLPALAAVQSGINGPVTLPCPCHAAKNTESLKSAALTASLMQNMKQWKRSWRPDPIVPASSWRLHGGKSRRTLAAAP